MNLVDSDEFGEKLLESKRQRVIEIVYLVCDKYNLPIPKINFKGCQFETQDELAHYHPDQNKICISEKQLHQLKTLQDIENTTYHELAHMIEQNHDGRFVQTKNKFSLGVWKPPQGVLYIKGDRKTEPLKPKKETTDKTRCNYHLCRKRRKLYKCPYCGRYFCYEHKKPVIPGKSILEERDLRSEKTDYHPCPDYVDIVKKQKEDKIKAYENALNNLKHNDYILNIKTNIEETGKKIEHTKAYEEAKEEQKAIAKAMSKEDIEESRIRLGVDTGFKPQTKKKSPFDKIKRLFGIDC